MRTTLNLSGLRVKRIKIIGPVNSCTVGLGAEGVVEHSMDGGWVVNFNGKCYWMDKGELCPVITEVMRWNWDLKAWEPML